MRRGRYGQKSSRKKATAARSCSPRSSSCSIAHSSAANAAARSPWTEEQRGLRQHECGPIAPEFPRQGGQPPGERFRLRAVDHGLRQGLEGVDRCARITALEVVAHRLRRFARLRPCLGRATMQHRQPVGLSFPKAPAQEGLEQVVVAIPVTLRLEPDRKEMLGDEIARHLRAVHPARDRLSQCGGEALEHRRLEQERLALRRLAGEHLLGQVVEQVTAGERAARTEAARLGGQDEPGHPALGLAVKRGDRRRVEVNARGLQQLRGLALVQGEVALAELEESRRAQAPQREGKRGAPGEHQVGDRRQIARQQPKRLAGGPGDGMDVVERDHEIVRDRVHDLVAERAHLLLGVALERQPGAEPRKALGNPGGEVGKKERGAGEPLVARAPDPDALAARLCLREERALAIPGPGEHRHERSREAIEHPLDEVLTRQAAGRQARREQA